jgi:cobaltochelatase CobT
VDTMLTSLQSKVEHMVSPMQKDLERAISARSLSVYSAGHRSGRLHPSNLSRLAIKTPAGFDDRVFRRRHDANSKDVAVELVIDASGSMNGSKIHTAAQAAYALASTLERIGIKSDVICFTTGEACAPWDVLHDETEKIGRAYSRVESLYMPVLKSFDERMSTEVKKRFGWLPNANFMASNVDGECVEIAARRLLSRRETGKVMIVLSDGAPAASGGARGLEAHLKKVVQNTIKRGVNVIGIGIESSAVQKFYPKNMVLNNVEELPGAVMKELRTLIVQN